MSLFPASPPRDRPPPSHLTLCPNSPSSVCGGNKPRCKPHLSPRLQHGFCCRRQQFRCSDLYRAKGDQGWPLRLARGQGTGSAAWLEPEGVRAPPGLCLGCRSGASSKGGRCRELNLPSLKIRPGQGKGFALLELPFAVYRLYMNKVKPLVSAWLSFQNKQTKPNHQTNIRNRAFCFLQSISKARVRQLN